MHLLVQLYSDVKYVALLRGVNVGDKRRVEMARLRETLVSMGFDNVSTYINSGNALFSSESPPDPTEIRRVLEDIFQCDIPLLIYSEDEILQIAHSIPVQWHNDTEQKTDVLYLFDEIDALTLVDILSAKPEIESCIHVDRAIIYTISRKNQSKGSLLRIAGTVAYRQVTIRNATTARKLADLITD